MICTNLSEILGFKCHPISDDGLVASIDTAFQFEDGDFIPIYLQSFSNQIRFFDGGETLFHLSGRGLNLNRSQGTRFIKTLVEKSGASLNKDGEIEVFCNGESISKAFSSYIQALLSIVRWEYDQQGINTDTDLFIHEVSMYFKSVYPHKEQKESPEYIGVSGHKYKFDFVHGGDAILAISSHPNSVASTLKKLIDIKQQSINSNLSSLVVIDDRQDKELANSQSKILTAVSKVLPMTTLQSKVNSLRSSH